MANEPKRMLSARVTPELYLRAKVYTAQTGMNMQDLIAVAVTEYLDRAERKSGRTKP
jgi:hypothetical protein